LRNIQIQNVNNICPVGTKLFHMGRQTNEGTNSHEEVNIHDFRLLQQVHEINALLGYYAAHISS